LHLYTPIPFKPWQQAVGDVLRPHFFVNGGACIANGAAGVGGWSAVPQRLAADTSVSYGCGVSIDMKVVKFELNYTAPLRQLGGHAAPPGLQFGIGIDFL
jgi:outer membrane protein assembly factor BamA